MVSDRAMATVAVGLMLAAVGCGDMRMGREAETRMGRLGPDSTFDVTDELSKAPGVETGERAHLVHIGDYARTPGKWRAPEKRVDIPEGREVAVLGTDPLRILRCTHKICGAYFVRRDAFAIVPTGRTPIRVGASGESGFAIAPGTRLGLGRQLDAASGRVEVAYDKTYVHADGWVRRSELGRVFAPNPFAEEDVAENIVIEGNDVTVYDTPGGEAIATLRPSGDADDDGHMRAISLDGGHSGFVEIRIRWKQWRLRGFVRAEYVRGRRGWAAGGVVGCGGYESETPRVSADTWFHVRPGGARFARAHLEAHVECRPATEDGWQKVVYPSEWGPVAAWVAPENAPQCEGQE